MKKIFLSLFITTVLVPFEAESQALIDTISLASTEETSAEFCFNNTKLMAGNNISDRYLVYYNSDTIFLAIYQSGNWTRKTAYTGSNIKSATLSFYKDTIWICWKEGVISAQIKARFTPDKGNSWTSISPVSPVGKVAAPSIYAASNGKIHFVWSTESSTDTTVYHRVYSNGTFLASPYPLSNSNAQGLWPSVIAIGDTVLCTWKEGPLPTKVWFRSSFDGGASWNLLPSLPTTTLLPISKDPNLAYAYDSTTYSHYVYLAYDSQNKIYLQRSTDLGNTWSPPDSVSNLNKLSQFAHIECNNQGFVGISYEQRPVGSSLYDDTKKDIGFTYSTNWANSGSFSIDTFAYAHNGFGSAYPAFNKIDENNFYLAWLTKDTVADKMKIFERRVYFNNSTGIYNSEHNLNANIILFPNPANSLLNIVLNENILPANKIIFYDVIGKEVKPVNIKSNGKYLQTDVSSLPKGIYHLTLQSGKMQYSKTFIIE
ncbi:MAG TPA: T9SS type A sorting domain-containing protein [Bacteroidia bacterium]|nr:T9SS type A sorting domain-containing protein [Bacteroidia bacterium]